MSPDPFIVFKYSDIVGQAVGIERDPANKRLGESAASDLNYVTWINESHELAREKGYSDDILEAARMSEADSGKFQKLSSLPQSYYRQAGSIAVKRAAQAGWRLAAEIERFQQEESSRHLPNSTFGGRLAFLIETCRMASISVAHLNNIHHKEIYKFTQTQYPA